jgi:hypothetical protein
MRPRHARLFCLILAGALSGCATPPESFVERIDNVEMSFVERYIASQWLNVFWNEDGTIDEFDFLETAITDDDLIEVAAHPKVRILKLGQTAITDAGLAHISSMTELVMLGLRRTRITDAGLVHVENLHKLRSLLIADTAITDAGLVHVEGLENLQELGLSYTAVTDAGLSHLHSLPKLALLHVRECDISEQAVAELREIYPEIVILPMDESKESPMRRSPEMVEGS